MTEKLPLVIKESKLADSAGESLTDTVKVPRKEGETEGEACTGLGMFSPAANFSSFS